MLTVAKDEKQVSILFHELLGTDFEFTVIPSTALYSANRNRLVFSVFSGLPVIFCKDTGHATEDKLKPLGALAWCGGTY